MRNRYEHDVWGLFGTFIYLIDADIYEEQEATWS